MEKQLPKNWVETEIENLFNLVYGKGLSVSELTDEGYDVYGANGIIGKYKEYTYENSKVIISCRGAASGAIHQTKPKSYITSNSIILNEVSSDLINLDFVKYMMINTNKETVITGTAQPQITIQLLKDLTIVLPPRPEQNRIVTKLDTLFAQLETIKQSMAKVPELLKDFRQQVLTQAVTGRLTEEFKYSNILKDIIEDKINWYNSQLLYSLKNKSKKPRKLVTEFSGDKDYLKEFLVKKIDIAFFDEISAKKENALKAGPFGSTLKKEFYVEKGYKIYGQEQVINDDPFYGDYYVNEEKFKELQSCEVEENDILISLVGTIGKVLIIPKDFEKGIINPRLVKLSLHEKVNPKFIKIFLQSSIVKDFLKEKSHGGTMDVLNLGIIKLLPIPLPSVEEQQEIVSRVESLFAKADAIEKQYESLKAKIEALPQAILHKAFKGELTEQLDSDGDARELLEQIQELKRETSKPKKQKALTP